MSNKKRTFGMKETLIIEQEIEKMMHRSAMSKDVLAAEDIKILEMLIKAKKLVLEREDLLEPEVIRDVTDTLSVEKLLELADSSEDIPDASN